MQARKVAAVWLALAAVFHSAARSMRSETLDPLVLLVGQSGELPKNWRYDFKPSALRPDGRAGFLVDARQRGGDNPISLFLEGQNTALQGSWTVVAKVGEFIQRGDGSWNTPIPVLSRTEDVAARKAEAELAAARRNTPPPPVFVAPLAATVPVEWGWLSIGLSLFAVLTWLACAIVASRIGLIYGQPNLMGFVGLLFGPLGLIAAYLGLIAHRLEKRTP